MYEFLIAIWRARLRRFDEFYVRCVSMFETSNKVGYAEWDNADFAIPKEFLLDENSSLANALTVFYAAGGYDFFNVVNPDKYASAWLEFIGSLYADIEDDVYKRDDGHFTFPLSEEERKSLIEQGIPEKFTSDF